MKIEIPDEIYENFLQFLDISQSHFTDDEVENFTDEEKKTLKFIEDLLGDDRTYRFFNKKEKKVATETFSNIFKIYKKL